jgi:hypothetical protein
MKSQDAHGLWCDSCYTEPWQFSVADGNILTGHSFTPPYSVLQEVPPDQELDFPLQRIWIERHVTMTKTNQKPVKQHESRETPDVKETQENLEQLHKT